MSQSNFYFNFTAAEKSRNAGLQGDVVMNELANVIATSPSAVISTIHHSGIPISKNASAGTIVSKIFNEGKHNNRLHNKISQLVILNHIASKNSASSADGDTYIGNVATGVFDHYDDEGKPVDKNGNYVTVPKKLHPFWNKLASVFKSIFTGFMGGTNSTDSMIAAIRPVTESFMPKASSDALLNEAKPTLNQYANGANIDTTLSNLQPIANKYISPAQSTALITGIKPILKQMAPASTPPPMSTQSAPMAQAPPPAINAPAFSPIIAPPLAQAAANQAKVNDMLTAKGVDTGTGAGKIIGYSVLALSAIGLVIYLYKKFKK